MKEYIGIYSVNNKIYTDKIEAILEANKTNADITWDFHNDEFKKINWTTEPELTLSDLYKLRAQQIRDSYDYVVVMFSGGADSTNVLHSFLSNNIQVDEIVAGIPLSGLRDFKASYNQNANNNASEWFLTTTPYLQNISQQYPNIRISINDFFKTMLEFKSDEWIYKSSDHVHPTTSARYQLDQLTHLRQLADQGKSIALVYGIEKPSLSIWQGKVFSTIWDSAVNVPRQPFENFYPNVDIVLFYTTPRMPEIIIKQSHVVMNSIFCNLQYKHIQDQIFSDAWDNTRKLAFSHGVYQRAIIPIIYPDIDMTHSFQALKSKNYFMADHDYWLYNLHKDTKLNEMFVSDFKAFFKSINSKYYLENMKETGVGFKGFFNSYNIGPLQNFKNLEIPTDTK